MDSIKLLQQWVKKDREYRNNEMISDFDKFCEERNQAIESLIYDAIIGKAITKWFIENGYVEKWGIELHDTDDLLEWAREEQ